MSDQTSIHVMVEFGDSKSPLMPATLRLAQQMHGISGKGPDGKTVYQVTMAIDVTRTDLRPLQQLYRLVSKRKGTRVELSGPGADMMNLPTLLSEVEKVRACHSRRIAGTLAPMYCSNKTSPAGDAACFGCRLLAGLQRLPHDRFDPLAWWNFGKLSDDLSGLATDKPSVLAYLKDRGRSQVCTLCPAFSWANVEQDVSDLPDQVELDEQSPFCIEYSQIDPLRPIGAKVRAPYLGAPRWLTS